MATEFKIQGLDAVLARLKALSSDQIGKAARSAGTKAMAIPRKQAAAEWRRIDDPKTGSNISKAVATRYNQKASKREKGVVIQVGIRGGARPAKGTEDTGHWRLLEFGFTNKFSGKHVPPLGIMRRALAGNIQPVTDAFVQLLDPSIDRIIAKVAK